MAITRTQADNGGPGFFHATANSLRLLSRAALMSAVLLAAASAQAADSSDRIIPPSPTEVAMLRQLLALQHPALRDASAPQVQPASVSPTVTTEPGKPTGEAPAATEGEACVSPDGKAVCAGSPEVAAERTAKLAGSFRASLDRAMAAAGFDGAKL